MTNFRSIKRRSRVAPFLLLLPAAVLAGCGGSPYDMAPVTGRVLVDGKPFAAGKVMFAPADNGADAEAGKPAFGLLDENGEFELSTYGDRDGAVVGSHWVTLYSLDDRRTDADAHVPAFRRVPTSDQTVQVRADADNRIEIELTSADIRKRAG